MDPLFMVKIPAPDQNTLWVNKEYGIRSDDEFKKHDQRTYPQIVSDFLDAQKHGIAYSGSSFYKRIDAAIGEIKPPQFDDATVIGRTNAKGLIILFHGLNGQPSLWDDHLNTLSQYSDFDSIALEVPEGGVCSFEDDRFKALLERIVDWSKQNPSKPIALFGQSNGGRVAAYFETLLRDHVPQTPVHVSLTGAVLFGSKTVSSTGIDVSASIKSGYNIYKDLSFGSETAKRLLKAIREPLKEGVAPRYYVMYAPHHDHHVNSQGSELPIINPDQQISKKERHYIVYNYGHNAIPLGVREKQIHKCIKWLNQMQGQTIDVEKKEISLL